MTALCKGTPSSADGAVQGGIALTRRRVSARSSFLMAKSTGPEVVKDGLWFTSSSQGFRASSNRMSYPMHRPQTPLTYRSSGSCCSGKEC